MRRSVVLIPILNRWWYSCQDTDSSTLQGRLPGLGTSAGCAIYYEAPWKSAQHLRAFLTAFQDVLSLFLITQSRTAYIPLYLFFTLQLYLFRRGRRHSVSEITILALLFQYASFFTFGGTNSIATIDLSTHTTALVDTTSSPSGY